MKSQPQKSLGVFFLIACLILLPGAKSPEKKPISLEDMKTWRDNSVSLSDDGTWYTVLYSLLEKPDEKAAKKNAPTDAPKEGQDKGLKKKDIDMYGEAAQTDVLYIRQADGKQEYAIEQGSKPQFSPDSAWVAYSIKSQDPKADEKEPANTIELRHLKTGQTKSWQSDAAFRFLGNEPYFISHDKSDLLLYHLLNKKEYYIGNIGEFLLDKKSHLLVYTIESKDKRGNGIYVYDLKTQTTRSLDSENCQYAGLFWNRDKTALAAVKFQRIKQEEPTDLRLLTIMNVLTTNPAVSEYKSADIKGTPESMRLDVEPASANSDLGWSQDNTRLFVRLKKAAQPPKKADPKQEPPAQEATVDVWHGQDKKLLSQQMVEAKDDADKTFLAMFMPGTKTLVPLTGLDMQAIFRAPDTDVWAIGTDDRAYISDWDVYKRDLYRLDLRSGERTLITTKYDGEIHISPDGQKAILWKEGHYWVVDFKANTQRNISQDAGVSFVDKGYDQYGAKPDYGFVGWVNDHESVIVNHHLDLWQLFLDGPGKAVAITQKTRGDQAIRYRFNDPAFSQKPDLEDRYIDLSKPHFLFACNILNKESGYYSLQGQEVKRLIFKPASFSASSWRRPSDLLKAKKSAALIYRSGTNKEFPEAYLTDTQFSTPQRITFTNPQQAQFKWGERILIGYTNDDGVPLQGILSIPEGYKPGQRLPMIVYSYEKLSQNLYQFPSLRISGSSVSEMMYLGDGYLFLQPDIHFNVGTPHSDMHECIDAAIAEVIRLGYVDEKRIGYEGFSFGGHCGMFIATQKNRFAAIAAGAGVSNLIQGFNVDIVGDGSNEQDYYMTQQGRLGADPTTKLDMYIRESAVFQAKNMQTPLLLFHGTADDVVAWEHSFGLYSILRYLKKPVIFLSYKGEGHGLRKLANRWDMHLRLKEYFDHYLKGKAAATWISQGLPYAPKIKADKEEEKEPGKPAKVLWK